jgi:hypothetical protein
MTPDKRCEFIASIVARYQGWGRAAVIYRRGSIVEKDLRNMKSATVPFTPGDVEAKIAQLPGAELAGALVTSGIPVFNPSETPRGGPPRIELLVANHDDREFAMDALVYYAEILRSAHDEFRSDRYRLYGIKINGQRVYCP